VAWTPDGKNIASAGDDSTIRVWNATPPPKSMFTAAVFSPDGSKIAAGNEYGDGFQIFYAKTQAKLGSALRHSGGVVCIAWNNDGTKLATGSKGLDSSVRIWSEVSTGTFECHSTLTGLHGHRYPCFYVVVQIFSRTGVLFSSDWGGGTLPVG
jgi:WD40 repeat protein